MSRNQRSVWRRDQAAIGWKRRVEETVSLEPSQIGGQKPTAISGEHVVWLLQRIVTGDSPRGLVAELAGRGSKVDWLAVWGSAIML
jgi:transposase